MRDVNQSVPPPSRQVIEAGALQTLQIVAKQDGQCVPTGVQMEPPTPATAVRIAVQGIQTGQLKNAWMAYGQSKGCRGSSRKRFVILLMTTAELRIRIVNEGESIASMSLMRDTSGSAAMAAVVAIKAVQPACDGAGMKMLATRIIAQSADLSADFYGARYKGNWKEGWTFQVCGRRAEVPVTFTADGTGGAYSNIEVKAVRLID